MVRPASRFTELNTWSGPTRSSSSTGGTVTTTMRRDSLDVVGIASDHYAALPNSFASGRRGVADSGESLSETGVHIPLDGRRRPRDGRAILIHERCAGVRVQVRGQRFE